MRRGDRKVSIRWSQVLGILSIAVACWSITGCGSPIDLSTLQQMPEEGRLGALCARNADCNSSQCLAVGRCTHECRSLADCPQSWGCDTVAAAGLLCTCTPTSETERCDGRDNDCNGFADDGATCPDGLLCINGGCACAPDRICDGNCVDLNNDPNHCGACGRSCGANGVCNGGQCACTGGLTACDGRCVNTAADVQHCGACGNACAEGARCLNGVCRSQPGGPCTSNADCTGGARCDTRAPGGMCTIDCVLGIGTCPTGSRCGLTACETECTSDANCRSGYYCYPLTLTCTVR